MESLDGYKMLCLYLVFLIFLKILFFVFYALHVVFESSDASLIVLDLKKNTASFCLVALHYLSLSLEENHFTKIYINLAKITPLYFRRSDRVRPCLINNRKLIILCQCQASCGYSQYKDFPFLFKEAFLKLYFLKTTSISHFKNIFQKLKFSLYFNFAFFSLLIVFFLKHL